MLDGFEPSPDVVADALAGLLATPKTLPPKLLYDTEGCRLFGAITDLPEYYVTRTELALLNDVAPAIGRVAPEGCVLVEYGAGSETKAAILARHLRAPAAYVPIDVAGDAVRATGRRMAALFPGLRVLPLAADFLAEIALPAGVGGLPRLGFFPGSTIGNLDPDSAVAFLARARGVLGRGALFCLGVDLAKDPAVLVPAYDDAAGVTAAFNLNLLTRLNREAAADFRPDAFQHRAVWNAARSRIEMHLVSQRAQIVRLAGHELAFAEGETIHTENSYKHTLPGFAALAAQGGWTMEQVWTDPRAYFSIQLLRAAA